ncbi:MAG: hypothetical protein CVV44_16830 [Spirochaetae bacterium HGW-Spirochaetae-1]|nr:MAG: hypothetical protein CVV44_16830 [Spirochaetae bacterium HGW-Spirochaetae-1]
MKNNIHFLLPCICLLLFMTVFLPRLRAETVVLNEKNSYDVHLEVLEDPEGTRSFNEVFETDLFKPAVRTNYGFTSLVIWSRFSVTIPENSKELWYLEIGYPLLDSIDFYISDGKSIQSRTMGDRLPFRDRDINHHNFLIQFPVKAGTYDCYFRVKTESSLSIPVQILSSRGVISELNIQKTLFGIFYGILLIMIIYNLLLAISMRDITYFWYSSFLISLTLVSLSLNGYGFQYIWPTVPALNNITPATLFLSIITMISFSRSYMNTKVNFPMFDRVAFFYGIFITACIFISFLVPYSLGIRVGAAAYLPGIGIIAFPMADSVIKKNREHQMYTLAFSTLFVGVIVTVLNRFGLLANHTWSLWGFQMGATASIALFSLGMANKVNNLNINLRKLNENLEVKVQERTSELIGTNEELEAAFEEMEAVNDNLVTLNRELEEAHNIQQRDMLLASKIQTSFLPSVTPSSDLYDIAFLFKPSAGISGDFYDFYHENNILTGAGLFDISGHGVSSGLITLLARSIVFRIFSKYKNEKLNTITEIINNRLISELGVVDNYITGILLRFREDKIDYVNCAHPAMLYRKKSTGKTGMVMNKDGLSVSGPFLGIETLLEPYHEFTLVLEKDDCLFLFTDSLVESRNSNDEPYGEIKLLQSLEEAPHGDAASILDYIMQRFNYHTGNANKLRDDLTAILIRKKI